MVFKNLHLKICKIIRGVLDYDFHGITPFIKIMVYWITIFKDFVKVIVYFIKTLKK